MRGPARFKLFGGEEQDEKWDGERASPLGRLQELIIVKSVLKLNSSSAEKLINAGLPKEKQGCGVQARKSIGSLAMVFQPAMTRHILDNAVAAIPARYLQPARHIDAAYDLGGMSLSSGQQLVNPHDLEETQETHVSQVARLSLNGCVAAALCWIELCGHQQYISDFKGTTH
ncbi:hypothetical protein LMH87_011064 [Akanthomyces muscarius]|uniref:Uncharacterized protein n=1 Tax=Akanthomyces muscarius TaxID=2231603 RepID=A0A9W8Q8Z8_AKAMU|nr:hypothetical protein LMH87_011064 [Akanthomyces muscarius]KAJ4150310.1 hypothetical protein LMH87_011064 [Akanthomyces muscarius]